MARFLTRRQKEILDFVRAFRRRHGVSPTHREICEEFGYSSYGTVHKHLKILQEKGYLQRTSNQKRGLELSQADAGDGAGTPPLVGELPFFGRIAAGRPIEVVAGDETLVVPSHLLGGDLGEHYVLRVEGQSMVDEGIFDGDLVVVRRREVAEAGEMIVALVEGEATLKRFFPEGAMVRLQPANAAMEPLRVPAERLHVQGVVVGLMRRY